MLENREITSIASSPLLPHIYSDFPRNTLNARSMQISCPIILDSLAQPNQQVKLPKPLGFLSPPVSSIKSEPTSVHRDRGLVLCSNGTSRRWTQFYYTQSLGAQKKSVVKQVYEVVRAVRGFSPPKLIKIVKH